LFKNPGSDIVKTHYAKTHPKSFPVMKIHITRKDFFTASILFQASSLLVPTAVGIGKETYERMGQNKVAKMKNFTLHQDYNSR
jgi:hypothetical protein